MPNHESYSPENSGAMTEHKIEHLVNLELPYKLKYPESIDILKEIVKNEMVSRFLDKLKEHAPFHYDHSLRVAVLCIDLSIQNKLSDERIRLNGSSGSLHDLGKCKVDKVILEYKGFPLPEEMRKVIRKHPKIAFDLLSDPFFDGIRERVVGHHENREDDPYPRDLRHVKSEEQERRKQDPTLVADTQMLSAADVFDSIYVHRDYNPEFSRSQIEEIMNNPKCYNGDPKFVQQLLERYEKLL